LGSILLIGFLIGMRHALEADHLAAVATLTGGGKGLGRSLRLGLAWGLGHTATLFLVGGAVLLVDGVLPERLALWLEAAVGIMLILLGADVLRRLLRERLHFHSHSHNHSHGTSRHIHAHSHAGEGRHEASGHDHEHPHFLPRRALAIGLVHGLAGSAALVLLTVEAMDSLLSGLLYMALFGLGSILGMGLLSCAIALPLRYAARQLTWGYTALTALLGAFSIGLGGFILRDSLAAVGLLT
jgi:ABC-type nickel/cobalt efflux system permease component RcnA